MREAAPKTKRQAQSVPLQLFSPRLADRPNTD